MEAIILAGGLGTRLRSVISEVPKPMAPVNDVPFLQYILDYLKVNNINKVVLAVGYKWGVIQSYFGNQYKGIELVYSVEQEPLGTGGAIKQALQKCDEDNVYIINGDTYFDVDLEEMMKEHLTQNSDLTIATKYMKKFDRYGRVIISDNRIIDFEEKKFNAEGDINGGIYICKKTILDSIQSDKFSFEKDIMEKYIDIYKFYCFRSASYFMDIGIPEDYKQFEIDAQSNKLKRC